MKYTILILLLGGLLGCGTPDVTGASVEDAMKERGEKARALDAKEGKAASDNSAEKSQDAQ